MFGWTGTILRVDLTKGKVTREATDLNAAHDYLGARGLGGKIISDEVDPKTDALGPDNKLIFAPGPLTGTFAPSAGRYEVDHQGSAQRRDRGLQLGRRVRSRAQVRRLRRPHHRRQGGQAGLPVDHGRRGRDPRRRGHLGPRHARHHRLVRAETDEDAKVACIGPAGEHLSLIANIMNEMHRAAGRTGVGAVMGSKNLKAIAVVRAAAPSRSRIRRRFKAAVMKARQMIQAHPVGGTGLKAYGTDVLVNILNQTGALPTRNFQDGYFPTADKTGGESLAAKQLIRPKGCFSCIISCGRVTKVDAPDYEGFGEGPEYETAWSFGADCGIDDLDAITKANYFCNEYGLDTISMGSTIACAMELFERGIITSKDTDGVQLTFGNTAAMVEMVRKTGKGEGFGAKLAQGSLPPRRELRSPRVLDDLQEAGDAGLRPARRAGHRPQLRHRQPRWLPRARLHHRHRGAAERRRDGPARHRGQGRPGHPLPEPHRGPRLQRGLPVRDLRHRRRRAGGDARGAHRRGIHTRRVHADRRAHLEPGAPLEPRSRATRRRTTRCRSAC